jgi:predicted nuclease with TOPRIM domain
MFGSSVREEEISKENKKLKERNAALESEVEQLELRMTELNDEVKEMQFQTKHAKETAALETEKALNTLRAEMQESLIKSDLLRTEALAKLEVYEKTDTKADANTIKEMVGQLISAIGKQGINVIK